MSPATRNEPCVADRRWTPLPMTRLTNLVDGLADALFWSHRERHCFQDVLDTALPLDDGLPVGYLAEQLFGLGAAPLGAASGEGPFPLAARRRGCRQDRRTGYSTPPRRAKATPLRTGSLRTSARAASRPVQRFFSTTAARRAMTIQRYSREPGGADVRTRLSQRHTATVIAGGPG